MNHLEHLLIFRPIVARCMHGHEAHLFTTDGAQCSCGCWWTWASTREEIDYLHDQHLEYVKRQDAKTAEVRYYHHLDLHELEWRGPRAAACKGCPWQAYGMDASRIVEAFSNHKQTVREELSK